MSLSKVVWGALQRAWYHKRTERGQMHAIFLRLSPSVDWLIANKTVSCVHQPEFYSNVMVWINVLSYWIFSCFHNWKHTSSWAIVILRTPAILHFLWKLNGQIWCGQGLKLNTCSPLPRYSLTGPAVLTGSIVPQRVCIPLASPTQDCMLTYHSAWLNSNATWGWLAGKMWLLFFPYPVTQRPEPLMDAAMTHSHGSTYLLALLCRKTLSWACSLKASLLSKHCRPNPDVFSSHAEQVPLSPKCKEMGVEGTIWTAESTPHLKVLILSYFF